MKRGSTDLQRGRLRARLETRRAEIEEMALCRFHAVSAPSEDADPSYLAGIRTAISAAIDYAFDAIELDREEPPAPPPALLVQARLAARNGVTLETMLRRYIAGYTIFGTVLFEEAERSGVELSGEALEQLARLYTAYFDQLLAAVAEEHRRETENHAVGTERGSLGLARRLLAGELVDPSPLAYELGDFHIGVVASGTAAPDLLRDLSRSLDRRLLLVQVDERTTWAWLGYRRPIDPAEMDRVTAWPLPTGLELAVGEPAEGLSGWRLTHRQAAAALPIAQCRPGSAIRYGDVALLASAMQDDLLATSLQQLYLAPLEGHRDGGRIARETLRAYFQADRNVSSAAAILRVSRNTVGSRLRAIETILARPLSSCAGKLELALDLESLTGKQLDG